MEPTVTALMGNNDARTAYVGINKEQIRGKEKGNQRYRITLREIITWLKFQSGL